VAAAGVANPKKCTVIALPTSSGKTFVGALMFQYHKKYTKKEVLMMVPSVELKVQMEN